MVIIRNNSHLAFHFDTNPSDELQEWVIEDMGVECGADRGLK
jgi:hypothetical protein